MILRTRHTLAALTVSAFAPLAAAISFSDFQRISGFNSDCTAAYRSALPDCSSADFRSDNPCSDRCAVGIQQVANLVNRECAGIAADPSTLIGIIFNGSAVASLCPSTRTAGGGGSAIGSAVRPSADTASATARPTSSESATASASDSTTAAATTSAASDAAASSAAASSVAPASPSSLTSDVSSSSAPRATSNANSAGGDIDPFNGAPAAAASYSAVFGAVCLVTALLL